MNTFEKEPLYVCYTAPAKFCFALVRGAHFTDRRLDVDDRPAHLRLHPDSLDTGDKHHVYSRDSAQAGARLRGRGVCGPLEPQAYYGDYQPPARVWSLAFAPAAFYRVVVGGLCGSLSRIGHLPVFHSCRKRPPASSCRRETPGERQCAWFAEFECCSSDRPTFRRYRRGIARAEWRGAVGCRFLPYRCYAYRAHCGRRQGSKDCDRLRCDCEPLDQGLAGMARGIAA